MTLQALTGFKSLQTHHCVSGSMRHVHTFNGYDVSEDLLLGMGEGVGFMHWQTKDAPPFFGRRTAPKLSMEAVAGQHTGVEFHQPASARKARQHMLKILATGRPVMPQVDIGFLPYFNFGEMDQVCRSKYASSDSILKFALHMKW